MGGACVSPSEVIAIVAIVAGVVGTLLGVVIGYALQQGAESRRYLREAGARLAAHALEANDHMMMSETEISGGPPADPLRPEFRSEQYLALTTVSLASSNVARAAADLGDAITEAIASQGTRDAKERQKGRDSIFLAIGAFEETVRRETASPWDRLRSKDR
jgi:hypothetical protein